MGTTSIAVLGLATITCAAIGLYAQERRDTGAAALPVRRVEGAEERGPVLLAPERSQDPTPVPVAVEPEREKTIEEAFDEGVVKEPPPDPLERGTSRLVVQVKAEETGEPVSADVQLWRLGAPGNVNWKAGDQLQAKGKLEAGSAEFVGLVEGTYRISSKDIRNGGEDPASFAVRGRLTEVSLRFAMPRKFDVRLRVLDLHGNVVREGKQRCEGASTYSHGPHEPDWVVSRSLRRGWAGWGRLGFGGSGCGRGSGTYTWIATQTDAFLWGSYAEPSRSSSSSSSHTLQVEGANDVSLYVKSDPARDRTFLAVAVPIDLLVAGVTLPSGRALLPADAQIEATCDAVLLEEGSPPELWRDLPIEVKVRLPDHEPLEFVARAGNPSLERTLRRVETAPLEIR